MAIPMELRGTENKSLKKMYIHKKIHFQLIEINDWVPFSGGLARYQCIERKWGEKWRQNFLTPLIVPHDLSRGYFTDKSHLYCCYYLHPV